ncbi:MAG: hypothetical protein J1E00_07625 [Oscillospiraceae bacterium]|nr:hypothetical protein [Oscillospiraceae bacterium]
MTEQKRDAFVFYRSYYEAMQSLPPEDRLTIYEAIFAYALDDEEQETEGVPAAVFMLVKPTLDASKRKAASGKAGGKASKAKATRKQTASKAQAIKDKGQETREKGQETREEGQETQDPSPSAAQTEAVCPFGQILERYHGICVSFPRLRSIEGERRRAVKARWRTYPSLETFEEVFRMAESSPFLKGQNDRGWQADFDWMMKESNFPKILEGKYNGRAVGCTERWDESYFSDPSAYENLQPL